jgi:hypothetical protein
MIVVERRVGPELRATETVSRRVAGGIAAPCLRNSRDHRIGGFAIHEVVRFGELQP